MTLLKFVSAPIVLPSINQSHADSIIDLFRTNPESSVSVRIPSLHEAVYINPNYD